MMVEPAHGAGDAPRTAPEQGSLPVVPVQNSSDDHSATRDEHAGRSPLPEPTPGACRRSEHQHWLRRRRLERQLHDGAALRISALTLQLGCLRHRVPQTEAELRESIDGLQEEMHAVLQELRDVARKIYPPLLDEAGLGPALREVADRVCTPVRIHTPEVRFGPAVEGAAYFAVEECLDALAPADSAVEVLIHPDGDVLVVQLTGVDLRHAPLMYEQVLGMGGTIEVAGESGLGTITARIPCE